MSTTGVSAGSTGTGVSIDSSTGLTTGSTLTNDGAGGTTQLVGLASGINTTELVQAEIAEMEEPADDMESEITGLQTEDSTLSSIQDSLQLVMVDTQVLSEPSLYFPTQSISSTNSSLVTATTTSGVGAVVGSSTVTVSQLASSAQRTFDFTSPSSADTLTIDGQSLQVSAGESAADVADAINQSDSLDVWASYQTTSGGQQQLVLSSRTTGDNDNGTGTYIDVQDGGVQVSGTGTYGSTGYVAGSDGSALSEVGSLAQDGADAQYTVNGVEGTSATDTVTNALPGVTLALSGITGSDPVTITTAAPAASTSNITSAVQQFVTDYNTAVTAIESDINTAPASESGSTDYNPNSGSLFGDVDLEDFLSEMRNSFYENQSGSGISSAMASLADIGISTGDSTGSVSDTSIDGELSVDTTTLTAAIESNPDAVQSVITSWASSMQKMLTSEAMPGGDLSERVSGNGTLISSLQTQYTSMMSMYSEEEEQMEEEWAQTEASLESLDNQKTTLTSFSNALDPSSSSS